jgi:hypothetical protein
MINEGMDRLKSNSRQKIRNQDLIFLLQAAESHKKFSVDVKLELFTVDFKTQQVEVQIFGA